MSIWLPNYFTLNGFCTHLVKVVHKWLEASNLMNFGSNLETARIVSRLWNLVLTGWSCGRAPNVPENSNLCILVEALSICFWRCLKKKVEKKISNSECQKRWLRKCQLRKWRFLRNKDKRK